MLTLGILQSCAVKGFVFFGYDYNFSPWRVYVWGLSIMKEPFAFSFAFSAFCSTKGSLLSSIIEADGFPYFDIFYCVNVYLFFKGAFLAVSGSLSI